MLNVLKSGSLNLLEFSGPVQACTGVALPFTFSNYIAASSLMGVTPVLTLSRNLILKTGTGNENHNVFQNMCMQLNDINA